MHELVAGVDLGGTKIYAALADMSGNIIAEEKVPTRAEAGVDHVLGNIRETLEDLKGRAGEYATIKAAGVGAPGPLDPETGIVHQAPNLGWRDVHLGSRLQELLGMPVYVDNDANLAALGECSFGAGKGIKNLVYITVSTGVGGGLVLNGKIYHGATGSAGEIGHMIAENEGPSCRCGIHGCLESMSSGTAIARRARELIDEGRGKEILRLAGEDPENVTARSVYEAAEKGDPESLAMIKDAAETLGRVVASLVNLLNPAMIVMGGGVMNNSGEILWGPMKEKFRRCCMQAPAKVVQIVPSVLGKRAGVMGALALAIAACSGEEVR